MIDKDKVVQFHYTLKRADGTVIEDSRKGEPMAYLHGAGNIIPGLEKALAGKNAGTPWTWWSRRKKATASAATA